MAEVKPSTNTLELTLFHRVTAITLMIASIGLFALSLILLPNYAAIKIPFLGLPSLVDENPSQTHYMKNITLILMFWVQHVVMASIIFKNALFKKIKYFVLYERYIYNITSVLALIYMYSNLQPSSSNLLFTIPAQVCLLLSLIGTVLYYWSLWQVGSTIIMPYKFTDLLYSKTVTYIPYGTKNQKGIITTGIYAYSRNPMQLALLLTISFGNGLYTIDRLIYVGIMCLFIVIGVNLEEQRMLEQFIDYRAYMQKVKSRFIFPF